MPTVITHAAVPLALYLASERGRISRPLLAAGVAAAILPDADMLAFAFDIAYAEAWGHRGATHSLAFAALVALAGACAARWLRSTPWQAAAWLFVCTLSHPLLDAMTSGGLGVALAWPWSEHRHFAPWRPILVSPFAGNFFNARGLATLLSELRWVWLPLFACAGMWKLVQAGPRSQRPGKHQSEK
ncbi:metal-dependent hydrolase [Luteimonas aestuarii]|uniref:Metal-dependent hydrolase n=1 Tax=Luteimonas aestuarii TaxID=453837 RepID=A0A4R5TKR7_9GAMM|nr:metal-dependent hydrolase [Luteimonas aestuarii]TDK20649.1 metal-dependent hydrolase [Luteimonas aestuarii]